MSVVDLLSAGEGFDDFIFYGLPHLPRTGEELRTTGFARTPGGGAVITAVAASRLGLRCRVVSAVSRETAGLLRVEGVGLTNLRRGREATALSVALSTPRDRAFVTFAGVNDRLTPRFRSAVARIRARHVHLAFAPVPCKPWLAIVARLRRQGTSTSWDFGWNPGLRRDRDFRSVAESVDYLFLNRDEAISYANARSLPAAVERWRAAPYCVVIKLGASGCRLVGRGLDLEADAVETRVVDTTGAGDAFNAGFLVARLRGLGLRAALRQGNRIGALSTRQPGGIAGLPRTS